MANQVGDLLPAVALVVQPEILFRARVAPLDAIALVENHHSLGKGCAGLLKASERRRQPRFDLRLAAHQACQVGEHFLPRAAALGTVGMSALLTQR